MSDKYKIEKGVPIRRQNSSALIHRMPLAEMEVGDSILIPNESGILLSTLHANVLTAAKYWVIKNNLPQEFTASTKSDKDCVRLWRTK